MCFFAQQTEVWGGFSVFEQGKNAAFLCLNYDPFQIVLAILFWVYTHQYDLHALRKSKDTRLIYQWTISLIDHESVKYHGSHLYEVFLLLFLYQRTLAEKHSLDCSVPSDDDSSKVMCLSRFMKLNTCLLYIMWSTSGINRYFSVCQCSVNSLNQFARTFLRLHTSARTQ